MRFLMASFLIAHGVAHVIGFLAPSYETAPLTDRLQAHAGTTRALGLLWLGTALAFVMAAMGLAMSAPWWPAVTAGTALLSLALSALEWPRAQVGVYINAAVLAWLATAPGF
jgi:hypothetical protein